ncbi:aspartyl-phosphate phosphatase Spo0E family protein [Gracilibacillus sp. YIM 98692]|uniref:aspartyl-phosphate phosphatase Spo0E family protein n=1 Tax=Gracilibacillus sp. YIM 98692 TaxID=2663532 RepID=UPI0013D0DCAB|nr:aspartyl-phosphate phosphatase Spo0E family protein [Gracilibacillus sp. YIM 98692]
MSKSERNVIPILKQIENMRRELVDIGLRDGLNAPSTLKHSELLDEQIKIYQKLKRKT